METRTSTRRRVRSGAAALAVVAVSMLASGCNQPWGPSTGPGPITGTLGPLVVDGVPEPTATVRVPSVCTPHAGRSTVTVQIQHNEHPVEVAVFSSYLPTALQVGSLGPGGGSVVLEASDQCWYVEITHLDLGTTGDDLGYRIDWVPDTLP